MGKMYVMDRNFRKAYFVCMCMFMGMCMCIYIYTEKNTKGKLNQDLL